MSSMLTTPTPHCIAPFVRITRPGRTDQTFSFDFLKFDRMGQKVLRDVQSDPEAEIWCGCSPDSKDCQLHPDCRPGERVGMRRKANFGPSHVANCPKFGSLRRAIKTHLDVVSSVRECADGFYYLVPGLKRVKTSQSSQVAKRRSERRRGAANPNRDRKAPGFALTTILKAALTHAFVSGTIHHAATQDSATFFQRFAGLNEVMHFENPKQELLVVGVSGSKERAIAFASQGNEPLLLGELAAVPLAKGKFYELTFADAPKPLLISKSRYDRARGSAFRNVPAALKSLGKPEGKYKVLVIGRASVDDNGDLSLVGVAFLATTRYYIAVDSEPERRVADYLVENNFKFWRPLLRAHLGLLLPDFLLYGKTRIVPLEVFGMKGHAEYDAKMELKLLAFEAQSIEFVEWDGTGPPPAFPVDVMPCGEFWFETFVKVRGLNTGCEIYAIRGEPRNA
jgi:hypothetical protein